MMLSDTPGWTPWAVAPGSGFEVDDASGVVSLVQINDTEFRVATGFRFSQPAVVRSIADHLQRARPDLTAEQVNARVEDARLYNVGVEPSTDLASIPRFARWFENTYGRHTLAAIIHDRLIMSGEPNKGALGSDALSDRFFREMMHAAGVVWVRRWAMWTAVAFRSRYAAGGHRRSMILGWVALAIIGYTLVVAAALSATGHRIEWIPGSTAGLALVAALLPLPACWLWGRQWAAGLIFAVLGVVLVPIMTAALIGDNVIKIASAIIERALPALNATPPTDNG